MKSWFQGLGYEEGFGPYEIPHTKVKKKQINAHVILSVVSHEERKNIFGEGRVFMFFFTCVIAFCT